MYHPLYSLSLLLLLLLLLFFLPDSNGNAVDSFTANCPSHMCGDVTVQYPFWRKDNLTSHQYCVYPGFGLDCCTAGDPIFYVAGDAFYVREIYYDNYTLNLVDRHAANLTCPRPRYNLTLETLQLGYSILDANISFYFNCTSYPPLAPPIECLRSGANESYVFSVGREPEGFDWVEYCEEKVVATVMEREVDINGLITGFGGAMNEGFVLDWRTMVDCRRCEDSDGRCGFNNVTYNFLCFCSDDTIKSDHCNDDGLNLGLKLGIGVGAASIVLLSFSICAIIYCIRKYSKTTSLPFWKRETENSKKVEAFIKQYGSSTPRRYKYSDIKKITNSFKHELGQGGYGSVYKGGLADGRLVAVKVLNTSKGNGEDFINEVASMGRTSHVNVVTLLGFCYEHKKRALIYEFMSNGSLEKFIYRKIPPTTDQHLGGEKLYEIAFGIARGLEYLHRGCNTRILHFDIKPHNILLDEDFCPKISDFGLAKLYPKKESIVSMLEARGTIGYIAPEVFSRNFGGVSHKSDVYSYGMMVLEMVGGRKNIDAGVCHTSEIYFPHWIYNQLELDQDLQLQGLITIEENKIAKKMILVGLWCIQADPSQRPSMNKVIGMLEGRMEALKIPPKPFLYSPQSPHHSSTTTTTLPI